MNGLMRSCRRPATSLSTSPSRTRGMAQAWAPEYSLASIQAGNVRETARVAASLKIARGQQILNELFMVRFRGGA